ncbi:LacI family DNA-binding transcriptional regulator [Amycolatopsis sp. FDAARGOS 1241]|uniref:LacI family DNA-binding transcriptional regulator n=1 Tax=Amycolatopsis sp. FDAARGOS 1241 TaxID=2778070 RepID=UPI00195177D7|nr:LacI family DNA-binding transcriptional regulator [Amycolatopsis sp. FDAARGOS 1241]QRP50418.1 LacI family DNA-binding transcriptional regulator [Amycolatopsis sp. FDAARGOS 1241]
MTAQQRRRGSVGVVDLARELGVSTATVSRALNGSTAVRPELAQRIRAHAESRGYVANRLARALSANTSRAFVGFVIPYVDTPAYSAVAAECARLLSADGTQMILTVTGNDPVQELRQLRELVASRIAGLVISPTTGVLDETRRLLGGLPVVELHRASGIEAPGVFSDDEQVLVESVLHLAALGHSNIGYLGTPEELSNGAVRLRGIRRGMELAGLDPDGMATRLREPTHENGYAAAEELLATDITALVVGGGSLSVGAAQAVRADRRRIPDDLSLVVYGDPMWFALADPPLTTIQVDYPGLARRAAQLLIEALDARHSGLAGPRPGPHLVTPHLLTGGSAAPPRT